MAKPSLECSIHDVHKSAAKLPGFYMQTAPISWTYIHMHVHMHAHIV